MSAGAPTTPRGDSVEFDAVTVAYREAVVLDRFSLLINPGEVVALIGPSGSGKSTALKAVAGFIRPASGRIRIAANDVTDHPPYERGLGLVVQNYALFPHMLVEDNVAFGLRARRAAPELIRQRVDESLRLTGMSGFGQRYPRQLSGGQQQRVAIARALAIQPRVLLLDEPLSALDAQIRRSMVEEIANLHRNLPGLTVLYVTHDQSEALTLADRIAILKDGRLSALGPSEALYRRPPNRFSAEFLGNANLLPVTGETPGSDRTPATVTFQGQRLQVSGGPETPMGDALMCVRPHALRLLDHEFSMPNRLTGTVQSVYWQGDQLLVRVDCGGVAVRLSLPPHLSTPRAGEPLRFGFDPADAHLVAVT